jgi:hypothetical protein
METEPRDASPIGGRRVRLLLIVVALVAAIGVGIAASDTFAGQIVGGAEGDFNRYLCLESSLKNRIPPHATVVPIEVDHTTASQDNVIRLVPMLTPWYHLAARATAGAYVVQIVRTPGGGCGGTSIRITRA